ncbi:MAG TPA: hypothetical protein DCS42_06290, partial [Nitrospiraceae bacterium]|nr:hypothetical protein [Nitrospiraceae bacterium]
MCDERCGPFPECLELLLNQFPPVIGALGPVATRVIPQTTGYGSSRTIKHHKALNVGDPLHIS